MAEWWLDLLKTALDGVPAEAAALGIGDGSLRKPFMEAAGRGSREVRYCPLGRGEGIPACLPAPATQPSYPFVALIGGAAHVPDWPLMMEKAVSLTAPGGTLLMTARSIPCPMPGRRPDRWRYGEDDLRRVFDGALEIGRLERDPAGATIAVLGRRIVKDAGLRAWADGLRGVPLLDLRTGGRVSGGMARRVRRPTVVLAMIVRDEAAVVGRCIDSVEGLFDAAVILDTGSTDGTPGLLRARGAEVHEEPFQDFVATKNRVLSLARGRGDLVLFMDADETLAAGARWMREWMDAGVECLSTPVHEQQVQDSPCVYDRCRLWRNRPENRYSGPRVHEALVSPGPVVRDDRIIVLHDRSHKPPESFRARALLNVRILEEWLAGAPGDPRALFYLARTCKDLGRWSASVSWYDACIASPAAGPAEVWQSAYDRGLCLKAMGEYARAFDAFRQALRLDPGRAEPWNAMGHCHYLRQEWAQAAGCYEKALSLPLPAASLFLDAREYDATPRDHLCVCYDRLRRYGKARDVVEPLAARRPSDERIAANARRAARMASRTVFFVLGSGPAAARGGGTGEGGADGVAESFRMLAAALAARGHRVTVFGPDGAARARAGVRFLPSARLARWRGEAPDAVVASRWLGSLSLPCAAGARTIAWLHDQPPADPAGLERADAVVVSSPWHRDALAECLGHRVRREALRVIPLGIRTALFDGVGARDPLRLFSRPGLDHGTALLTGMWEEIRRAVPGVTLSLVRGGPGPAEWGGGAQWRRQVRQRDASMAAFAGSRPEVTLLGGLGERELARELQRAVLCLHPSDAAEAFCVTAQAAQAAGTPVVAPRLGALGTTLYGEANVILDEAPGSEPFRRRFIQETVSLLRDDARRAAMSERCRSHARESPADWSDVGRLWEELLYELA